MTDTKTRVIGLLTQGTKQHDIAKQLGISKQLVSYHAQQVKKVKEKSKEVKGQSTDATTDYNEISSLTYTSRLHKHTFFFKLKASIGKDGPAEVAVSSRLRYRSIRGMRGHSDALLLDYKPPARLYPNGLLVYAPQIETPAEAPISDLLAQSYEEASRIASDFEARTGLHFKRLTKDSFIATVKQQHIALKNTTIAEWFREHHESLIVPDPDGGEPLLVIDFSHGTGELETLNVQKGEFVIQRAKDLLNATAQGRFDYEKEHELLRWVTEALNGMLAVQQGIVSEQANFAKNLSEHVAAIRELRELAANMNRKLNQMWL